MIGYLPNSRKGAIEPGLSTDRDPAIPIYAVSVKLFRSDGPVFIITKVVENAKQQFTAASPSRGNQHRAHKLGTGKMVAIGTPERVHLLPLRTHR